MHLNLQLDHLNVPYGLLQLHAATTAAAALNAAAAAG
jgi:hypothetical protein